MIPIKEIRDDPERISQAIAQKGEDIQIEQNISQDDVSSSCLICHK